MSLSIIEHNGRNVLYIDYSRCKSTEEMLAILETVKEHFVRSHGTFLTLNDFTGVTADNEFMAKVKSYSNKIFDPRTERSAVLGVTGLKKMILCMYNTMVSNKQVPFYDKTKALNYLTASDVYKVKIRQ